MSSNPFSEYGAQPTPPPRKAPTWKKVFAWTAAILGGIVIFGNLFSGSFRGILAGICVGLVFLLPGAWYLMHERREANGATPLKRYWWWIIAACVGLLILGTAVSPETTTEPKDSTTTPESTTSPMSSTSSEPESTSTTRTTEPTSSAPSPFMELAPTTEQPAPAPAPQEQPEPEQNTQIQQFAPAPEIQEEAPAPAPAQPAPAYSGGGNSGTCADIGHKVYRGDGIYLPKHDKDGDGVGCESYPG